MQTLQANLSQGSGRTSKLGRSPEAILWLQECDREALSYDSHNMRVKVKKTVQSNSQIDTFIAKVVSAPSDNLAAVLANFKWTFDKVSNMPMGHLTI